MKPKVYGKKSRTATTTDFCTILNSSTETTELRGSVEIPAKVIQKGVDVLLRKTSNTRLERVAPKSVTPEEEPKRLESLKHDGRKTRKNAEKESKAERIHSRTDTGTTSPGDITRALSDLEIKDDAARSALESRKPASQPAIPQIAPQLAHVSASTTAYVAPILACKSVSPQIEDFALWLGARTPHLDLRKIGEGSYGEVYRATSKSAPSSASSAAAAAAGPSTAHAPTPSTAILKLIPLRAQRGTNSRSLTPIAAAAIELRLLARMQRVPGFVDYRGACILRGRLPAPLVRLWRAYRDDAAAAGGGAGRTIGSRDPGRKGAWPDGQLWLVIEMGDAGCSLEDVVRCGGDGAAEEGRVDGVEVDMGTIGEGRSVRHVWDVFWQIVAALAKAELSAQFEHRDLHLGNICVKRRLGLPQTDASGSASGFPYPPMFTGLEVTLIDYTLSRATLPTANDAKETLCFDFKADKQLFAGEGDPQYDVYRAMVSALGERDAAAFVPSTNVLWLGYVLRSLTEKCNGKKTRRASEQDKMWAEAEKRMKVVLEEVKELTRKKRLSNAEDTLSSAGELLDLGIHSGWMSMEGVAF